MARFYRNTALMFSLTAIAAGTLLAAGGLHSSLAKDPKFELVAQGSARAGEAREPTWARPVPGKFDVLLATLGGGRGGTATIDIHAYEKYEVRCRTNRGSVRLSAPDVGIGTAAEPVEVPCSTHGEQVNFIVDLSEARDDVQVSASASAGVEWRVFLYGPKSGARRFRDLDGAKVLTSSGPWLGKSIVLNFMAVDAYSVETVCSGAGFVTIVATDTGVHTSGVAHSFVQRCQGSSESPEFQPGVDTSSDVEGFTYERTSREPLPQSIVIVPSATAGYVSARATTSG